MFNPFTCLSEGDFIMGGAILAVGVFLHKFVWSKAVSKAECKRVHDSNNENLKEIKEDVRMIIRRLIDPDYKNNIH